MPTENCVRSLHRLPAHLFRDTRPFTRVAEVTRGPHAAQRWRPLGARTGRSPAHARTPRRYERRSRARPRRRRACQRRRADQVELRRARSQLGQGRARQVPCALVRALQVDEARLRQARRGVQGLLLCRDRCALLADTTSSRTTHTHEHATRMAPPRASHPITPRPHPHPNQATRTAPRRARSCATPTTCVATRPSSTSPARPGPRLGVGVGVRVPPQA